MNRLKISAASVGMVLLGSACSNPETRVYTQDTRPTLAIVGAPRGSSLYVDGKMIGPANNYNGKPNVLIVLPGSHQIEVKSAEGGPVYEKKAFFSSELKEIKVGDEQ